MKESFDKSTYLETIINEAIEEYMAENQNNFIAISPDMDLGSESPLENLHIK